MTEPTTHPCNCENTTCENGHTVTREAQFESCPNPGKYAVKFVGAICEGCARFMPATYGREPTIAEVHAYQLKALDELSPE